MRSQGVPGQIKTKDLTRQRSRQRAIYATILCDLVPPEPEMVQPDIFADDRKVINLYHNFKARPEGLHISEN